MIAVPASADQPIASLRRDLKPSFCINTFRDQRKYGVRNYGGDAISYHSKAMPNGWMELKAIRKALQARSFSDSYHAVLVWMNRTNGLE